MSTLSKIAELLKMGPDKEPLDKTAEDRLESEVDKLIEKAFSMDKTASNDDVLGELEKVASTDTDTTPGDGSADGSTDEPASTDAGDSTQATDNAGTPPGITASQLKKIAAVKSEFFKDSPDKAKVFEKLALNHLAAKSRIIHDADFATYQGTTDDSGVAAHAAGGETVNPPPAE